MYNINSIQNLPANNKIYTHIMKMILNINTYTSTYQYVVSYYQNPNEQQYILYRL